MKYINNYNFNKNNQTKKGNFKNECEIKEIIECNMDIFNLMFVKSEFKTTNPPHFRYDTLCLDESNRVFVIVEYKNKPYSGLTDQLLAYPSALISSKREALNLYNEKYNKNLTEDDINWNQTRILVIATEFTKKQQFGYKELYKVFNDRIAIYYIKKTGYNTINLMNFADVHYDTEFNEEGYFYIPNILFSNLNLTLEEFRLLYFLIYKIDKNTIKITEYMHNYNLNGKGVYQNVKKACSKLQNLILEINNKKIKCFNYLKYTTFVKYEFSTEFLNEIKYRYTKINFNSINNFYCKYSFLIYSFIISNFQQNNSNFFKIDLLDFKNILGIRDTYPKFSNFKIKVLEKAKEDINKNTEINFVYTNLKKYTGESNKLEFSFRFKDYTISTKF